MNVQYNPHYNVDMKTIQITIDEKLLTRMDRVLKGRPRLRSAFIRESIANQLRFLRRGQLEALHREGYRKLPVREGEFDLPGNKRAWGGA